MNKIYFENEISGLQLRITESYVQYGSDVIPTSAISYFAVRRASVSWWPAILLFLSGIALFFCGNSKITNGWDSILQSLGVIALVGSIIATIVIFIESRKRYVFISSHSQHCIEIWIHGKDYKDSYTPLMTALFDVIEDNHHHVDNNSGV